MRQENIAMVILAGGASSRMGSDKADLQFGKATFLETQIEKGRQMDIGEILVSGYKGVHCSVPVIPDRMPGKGPLAGLEACFRSSQAKYCLVLSVDVPQVPLEELRRMVQYHTEKPLILQHGEKQEPLIGIYPVCLADEMVREIQEGKGSVFAFLRRVGYETYHSDRSDQFFENINDPQTYEWLQQNADCM